jgi:sulfite reductase alpha subunit-like flavoprotein
MKLAVTSFTGTAIICLVATTCVVDAFAPCHIASAHKASAVTTATTTSALLGSKVGIWYSSSTGNTETVASYIAKAAGEKDFNDIGDAKIDEIEGADCLIVGAPTWHTGADEQRSGTSWDEWFVYFMMHASCRR